jgi:hypothetical protein
MKGCATTSTRTCAADRNQDAGISATEAHDYARRRTYAFTGGRQRPSAEILEVGADPIILSGRLRTTGVPELFSYNPRLEGFTLKVDGAAATELPGGAVVAPGRRRLQLEKGGAVIATREIELRSGERTDVGELFFPPSRRRALFLMAGGAGFIDATSRNELSPASLAAGVGLRVDDVPLPSFSLWIDAAAGGGEGLLALSPGTSAPIPYTYMSSTLGVGAGYRWELGPVIALAGPRLSALYIRRAFDLSDYRQTQQLVTAMPGAFVSVAVPLGSRVELAVLAHLGTAYISADGAGRLTPLGSASAALGYRF